MRTHALPVLPRSRPFPLLRAAMLGLLLGACASSGASSGSQKAEKTVRSSEKLSVQVTELAADVEEAGASLDALRGSFATEGLISRETVAKGDLEATYKQYRSRVKAVRSSGQKVESTNATLKKDLEAFLATWEANMAQVQNEKLREASLKRRTAAQERYQKVSDGFAKTWEAFQAHQAELIDIELALGSDLTPLGLKAIDDVLKDARKAGQSVQEGLAKAAETLSEFAAAVRSSAPPEPAAPAK